MGHAGSFVSALTLYSKDLQYDPVKDFEPISRVATGVVVLVVHPSVPVSSATRFAGAPEIPIAVEAGIPGMEAKLWFGLFAPAKTPRSVVIKLNREIGDILRRPETREQLLAQGAEPTPSSPEELGEWVRTEIDKWTPLIRKTGITADQARLPVRAVKPDIEKEASMQQRRLGKNGPLVSAVGLGAGSTTTDFGERDDDVQIETIHRALDLGVTLFDTANRYMGGRHERIVGRALKGRRDEVVIATKFGNFDLPDGTKGYNGRPDYVPQACDASLKQLGVDVIDLYYLHRIDPDVPIEETVGAMSRLVEAGKVRWLGLSEAGPKTLARACKIHPIAALQTEYSLWARDVEDEILPACRELGIGFVPYSPLGRGLLTGRVRSLDDIAPHDLRRRQPRFQPGNMEKNLELLKPIEAIAEKRGVSPAQVSLAWLLSRGDDMVPIPGTKQKKWLEQNVAAADLVLDKDEIDLLSETFKPGARAGERYNPGYFVTLGA